MPKKTTETPSAVTAPTIDYPQAAEKIVSPIYSIRLSAPQAEKVEVTIDGGPAQECRRAAGHFWFDWSGYMSGRHEILAYARYADGSAAVAKARKVLVEIPI